MIRRKLRIAAGICAHNEQDYILYSIRALYDFVDVVAVSVDVGPPWGAGQEALDRTLELVRSFPDPDGKVRVLEGQWADEIEQRNANLDFAREEGIRYYMVVDPDEMEPDTGGCSSRIAVSPMKAKLARPSSFRRSGSP